MNIDMLASVAAPSVNVEQWLPHFQAVCDEFGIQGDAACAFLANAAHESTGFTEFEENLNYRWDALVGQWPRRFSIEVALRVGRVPKTVMTEQGEGVVYGNTFYPATKHGAILNDIANIAYGGRYGNVHEGDGWKYRGRGCFQLTFYDNYMSFFGYCGVPEMINTPEVVATEVQYIVRSAGHFWKNNDLTNVLMTRGFAACRRKINGGELGLQETEAHYRHLQTML